MRCPHCGALGEVVGQTPDILPKSIQCGGCRESFLYIGTALERIFADATTDRDKPFYFRPYCRGEPKPPPPKPEDPPDPRRERLLRTPTRELIRAMHRCRGYPPHTDNDPVYLGDYLVFTAGEVKAVLATRPHIPAQRITVKLEVNTHEEITLQHLHDWLTERLRTCKMGYVSLRDFKEEPKVTKWDALTADEES